MPRASGSGSNAVIDLDDASSSSLEQVATAVRRGNGKRKQRAPPTSREQPIVLDDDDNDDEDETQYRMPKWARTALGPVGKGKAPALRKSKAESSEVGTRGPSAGPSTLRPSEMEELETELSCAICYHLVVNPVSLAPCQHYFCDTCVGEYLKTRQECPSCRGKVVGMPQRARALERIVDIAFRASMSVLESDGRLAEASRQRKEREELVTQAATARMAAEVMRAPAIQHHAPYAAQLPFVAAWAPLPIIAGGAPAAIDHMVNQLMQYPLQTRQVRIGNMPGDLLALLTPAHFDRLSGP